MARYDGMDEILERVSVRAQQSDRVAVDDSPAVRQAPSPVTESRRYVRAADLTVATLHEAQRLREALTVEGIQPVSQREHDDLLGMLGQVLQELWACEVALQRIAPYD